MKLRKGDAVIGMDVVIPNSELVVITENGYGKRTDINQFTPHHRGGVGIKAGVVTPKTGKTVDIKTIMGVKEDLIVISKQGTIIRTPLKNISKIGRATQGVRIMRVSEGDNISSIASIPKIKDEGEKLEGAAKEEIKIPTPVQKKLPETRNLGRKKFKKKVIVKQSVRGDQKKQGKKPTIKSKTNLKQRSLGYKSKKSNFNSKGKRVTINSKVNSGFKIKRIEKQQAKKLNNEFKVKKLK